MAAPSRNAQLLTAEELAGRLGELYRALDEFNDGYYFESHETLEDLWMVTPLPERTLFQGIIQIAAAYVHVARGEFPGAVKLLDAAVAKLREFAPASLGIDVAAMVAAVSAARRQLASDGAGTSVRAALAARPRWRYEKPGSGEALASMGELQLLSNKNLRQIP